MTEDKQDLGINISSNQYHILYDKVAESGKTFAYVKSSEGNKTDASAYRHLVGLTDSGINTGLLHMLYPTRGHHNGALEGRHFCNAIRNLRPKNKEANLLKLAVGLDKTNGMQGPQIRKYVYDAMTEVKNRTGHTPILYTNPFFMDYWGLELAEFPLYVQHHNINKPVVPKPFTNYVAWEFNKHGRVNGVGGYCKESKTSRMSDLVLGRDIYSD